VIECREKSLPLSEDDLKGYINHFGNIKIAVLRIPYEIRIIPKYRTYITKREQDDYGK
jgi:hypothetical protein